MKAKPTLLVIAGCNGSGKSSYSRALVTNQIVPFDYDKIFLQKYRELIDSELRDRMAHNLTMSDLKDSIQIAIRQGRSFCYETNFNSTPLHWPNKFKESNFLLEMIYFCLDSVEEAKRRVQIRVENGGHFVPELEIEKRYYQGFENLNKHFKYFDRIHLLNSSFYNQIPKHILSLENGTLIKKESNPEFLSNLIPNILSN